MRALPVLKPHKGIRMQIQGNRRNQRLAHHRNCNCFSCCDWSYFLLRCQTTSPIELPSYYNGQSAHLRTASERLSTGVRCTGLSTPNDRGICLGKLYGQSLHKEKTRFYRPS